VRAEAVAVPAVEMSMFDLSRWNFCRLCSRLSSTIETKLQPRRAKGRADFRNASCVRYIVKLLNRYIES
jgi:hypothetical protein